MTKPATVELLLPAHAERRCPGRLSRLKRIIDLAKLGKLSVAAPASAGQGIEDLLIFDARFVEASAARELLRLLPELVHMRHAWKVHFVAFGCLSCHRKRVPYGAGGLCRRCQRRTGYRLREHCRQVGLGRDLAEELATITRKFDAAKLLLGGDE